MKKSALSAQVLILSSSETERGIEINDDFIRRLNQTFPGNFRLTWANYHNLGMEVSGGKLKVFLIDSGRELRSFKAVYFKSYYRYIEQAAFVAEYLRQNHITFVGQELADYVPEHKLSQLARLASVGIRVPASIYLPLEHFLNSYDSLVTRLGNPFIFKLINGNSGDFNFLIKSRRQLAEIIQSNQGKQFVAQKFIPNKSDLRVIILKGKIQLIMERQRRSNSTHLNNTSQGGQARSVASNDLPKNLQQLALKAARTIKRDLTGIDLMLEEGTGLPYILEVNASPQMATGALAAEKASMMAQYLQKLAGANKVDVMNEVGRAENVDLPDYGLQGVPAKVDTGADSSSIWASQVKEKSNGLHFTLFGPASPFYTGKELVAKEYSLTRIANSFGQKELRYKIKLRIRVGGRLVRATFTLSDRSLKTYPVLLGRRLLKDKFLVNVSTGKSLKPKEGAS